MTTTIRRNPIIRAIALLALALGLFATVPSTAGAVEACTINDYGNTMQLTANPPTVAPGGQTTITGTGYPPNCLLGVSVGSCDASMSIGSVTTNPDGSFSIKWAVPANQKPGDVVVCTTVSKVEVTAHVTVSSTTATVPNTGGQGSGGQGSGILPKTGSQVLPFVGFGVLLLVGGSLLVLSSRKRSNSH